MAVKRYETTDQPLRLVPGGGLNVAYRGGLLVEVQGSSISATQFKHPERSASALRGLARADALVNVGKLPFTPVARQMRAAVGGVD